MNWFVIGSVIYLLIGWGYARLYQYHVKVTPGEKEEPGAYYVALFLWLAVLIYSLFDQSWKEKE